MHFLAGAVRGALLAGVIAVGVAAGLMLANQLAGPSTN